MTAPARIYIGTPTPNGFVAAEHATSLAAMLSSLHGQGIGTIYRNVDGPDLAIQRDMLAFDFIASDCTHLLLIDGEMSFAPGLCQTLLGFGKEVIGAAYATRSLDLARFEQHLKTRSFEAARALAYDWNSRLIGGAITVRNGIGRVEALGPGFLLIARSAVERVARSRDTPVYQSPAGSGVLPALFRDLSLGSAVWSHDHVFCQRWAGLGGETWAFVHAEVRRIAEMRFGVPYRGFLEATLASSRLNQPGARAAGAPS